MAEKKSTVEATVKNIRRNTRKKYSAEEKILVDKKESIKSTPEEPYKKFIGVDADRIIEYIMKNH